MRGFGGSHSLSLGSCIVTVEVDGLILKCSVEITNSDLPDIDIILGQPMNVSLVTTATSVNFVPTHYLSDILLNGNDFVSKYSVF